MAPALRDILPVAAARQALGAARSPACWRRRLGEGSGRIRQLSRICAWLSRWASLRPRLRPGPLWGTALSRAAELPPPQRQDSAARAKPHPLSTAAPEQGSPSWRKPPGAAASRVRKMEAAPPESAVERVRTLTAKVPKELLERFVPAKAHPADRPSPDPSPGSPGPQPKLVKRHRAAPSPGPATESTPGDRGKPASARTSAPEMKKIAAWQQQLWGKVRRTLAREARAAPSTATAVTPDRSPQAVPRKRSTPSAAAPESSAGGGPPTISSPWQKPVGGPTVSDETLAMLAGQSAASPQSPEQKPARPPASGGQRPEGAPDVSAPGTGKPAPTARAADFLPGVRSAQVPADFAPFDRPLRELLRRDRSPGDDRHGVGAAGPESEILPQTPAGAGHWPPQPLPSGGAASGEEPRNGRPSLRPRPWPWPQANEDEIERLTEQLQQILQEEARRHGIDL